MHALRSSIARATTRKTTPLAPPRHSRAPLRAMASADGTKLDKSTPEAVWRGILTPEEVSDRWSGCGIGERRQVSGACGRGDANTAPTIASAPVHASTRHAP